MCVEEMLWLNSSVCALIIGKLEGESRYAAAPGTGPKPALREYQSQPAVVGFDPARCRRRGWLFFSGASEPLSANPARWRCRVLAGRGHFLRYPDRVWA